MKPFKAVAATLGIGLLATLVVAFRPDSSSFNGNQFAYPGTTINIVNGALLTNVVHQITSGNFYRVLYPGQTAAESISGSGTLQWFDNLGNAILQYPVGSVSYFVNTNLVVNGSVTVNASSPNSSFAGSVTATNGFQLTTNPIPALVLTAGLGYYTNLSQDITLAAFAGVPNNYVWSIYLMATNSSGSNWKITWPAGVGGSGWGNPPVITVTNKQSAQFQVNGYGNLATNVSWQPIF
jgi:hypothetical protein